MSSFLGNQSCAVDMEASGFAAALDIFQKPSFAVVKGVADLADGSKSSEWQYYAADVAAAFAWWYIGALAIQERIGAQPVSPTVIEMGSRAFQS